MAAVPTFKSHESSRITIRVSTYVYNSAVRALFFNNSLQRIMFARHLKYLRGILPTSNIVDIVVEVESTSLDCLNLNGI